VPDTYTKAVLTMIALALSVLAWRSVATSEAKAQAPPPAARTTPPTHTATVDDPNHLICEWSYIIDLGPPELGINGKVSMSDIWQRMSEGGWRLVQVRDTYFFFERCGSAAEKRRVASEKAQKAKDQAAQRQAEHAKKLQEARVRTQASLAKDGKLPLGDPASIEAGMKTLNSWIGRRVRFVPQSGTRVTEGILKSVGTTRATVNKLGQKTRVTLSTMQYAILVSK